MYIYSDEWQRWQREASSGPLGIVNSYNPFLSTIFSASFKKYSMVMTTEWHFNRSLFLPVLTGDAFFLSRVFSSFCLPAGSSTSSCEAERERERASRLQPQRSTTKDLKGLCFLTVRLLTKKPCDGCDDLFWNFAWREKSECAAWKCNRRWRGCWR